MIRMMFIPLAATLLAVVPCAAQTKPIQDEVRERLDTQRQAQLMKQAEAERAEDVEILRRILNHSRGLPIHATTSAPVFPMNGMDVGNPHLPYPPGAPGGWSGPSFQPDMHNSFGYFPTQTSSVGPFDGVSLPGYGVIYTLRIPDKISLVLDPPAKSASLAETCRKCHSTEPVSRTALEPTTDKTHPPTEWDRTRRELRGMKHTVNQQPAARLTRQQICQPGNLTDRIVEKLWQNMQHIRHLAPTDRVTVVITFEGLTGSSKNRQKLDSPSTRPTNGPFTLPPVATPKNPSGHSGFWSEEAQQLTLGDLHLKQGKPSEAVEAYQRALTRYKKPVYHTSGYELYTDKWERLSDAQRKEVVADIQQSVRSAYRRLAQAWLAAGDVEKGQAALEMARKFTVELDAATLDKGDKGITVPAKLIISVTRADADKAGNNLLNFRKAVKVETIGFPPADHAKK